MGSHCTQAEFIHLKKLDKDKENIPNQTMIAPANALFFGSLKLQIYDQATGAIKIGQSF